MYHASLSLPERVCTIWLLCSVINLNRQATVLGSILLDLYGIHKQSLETRLALARKHHNAVKHLGHASNAFLEQDTSGLRTMFRQQVFGAKLAFAHLHIVLFRPFLLDSSADIDHTNSVLQQEHANNISLCMQTAMEIARYVESIFNVSQFFNGSWVCRFQSISIATNQIVYSLLWLHSYSSSLRLCNQESE